MDKTNEQYIITGTICKEDGLVEDQYLLIDGEKVIETGHLSEMPPSFSGKVFTYPKEYSIVPGFIDIHIHGAAGSDAMDATTEALNNMAVNLVKEGTTTFFATTMTQSIPAIDTALEKARQYIENNNEVGKAEVCGIHLEGPFVNPIRKGAQPGEHIIEPNIEIFKKWQDLAGGHIKLITMAPERNGGYELVQYLSETGVVASIGHSDADFDQVSLAVEKGASHATHLFNGMKGLHHREPGTAGGALLKDEIMVEIIADGFHINPHMIDLAIRLKGLDRAVLITDSMRAKWLQDGVSELGGQEVFVKEGKATLANGSLAGSILKMHDGIKNIMQYTGLTLPQAVKLATINPAREFGLDDRKGSLEVGKDADIVVLNEDLDPILTICRGEFAYKK